MSVSLLRFGINEGTLTLFRLSLIEIPVHLAGKGERPLIRLLAGNTGSKLCNPI